MREFSPEIIPQVVGGDGHGHAARVPAREHPPPAANTLGEGLPRSLTSLQRQLPLGRRVDVRTGQGAPEHVLPLVAFYLENLAREQPAVSPQLFPDAVRQTRLLTLAACEGKRIFRIFDSRSYLRSLEMPALAILMALTLEMCGWSRRIAFTRSEEHT